MEKILVSQPATQEVTSSRTADVVIAGAGFEGLSAALRIIQLQPAAKAAIVEAARIASGSSGRNLGFMIDLPHDLASDGYAGAGDDKTMIAT